MPLPTSVVHGSDTLYRTTPSTRQRTYVIVQPTFQVPPDIETGLLNGDLIRYGGVVRDAGGRLVTHLKEIPDAEKSIIEGAQRTASRLKNPWVAVGVGIVLVAVGGGVVLALKRRKKDAEFAVPECVQEYIRSLRLYLDAIQNGTLSPQLIDRLATALDSLAAYGEEGEVVIAFSPEQLGRLIEIVVDYTTDLVAANGVELDGPDTVPGEPPDGDVDDLRRHLELQRRIFDEAA